MSSPTQRLSEFVATISYDQLPGEVTERTKLLVTDLLGIAIRARYQAESTPSLLAATNELGLASGSASVVGDTNTYAPTGAALINGTLAHSLDFDDTHARGSIHPSAPIVPAAWAAAEMVGASGRELLTAIVAGYEVQIRLSLALVPKDHYERGFHPTATCGTFGAAAAAARIFGLSIDQVANAFGICLSQSAGSMQFLVDGAWTKRFHVGYAAMNGLVAASFARAGFRGAMDAIEGKAGFLHAYAPHPMVERTTDGLGDRYETMAIAIKPYPACRYSHAAIDALLALREHHNIDPQEIESIEIGLPRTGYNLIGDPEADKQRPRNIVDGQFSMPFVAAVALREGCFEWDHYKNHLGDPATLALCKRVTSCVDSRAEAEFPANMSGAAKIRTTHGEFEKFVTVPKGEPDNFVTPAEVRAKFDALVSPYLSEKKRGALTSALLSLERIDDVSRLLRLTHADSTVTPRAAAHI